MAINGDAPIQYPPRLFDQRVEGDVVLRLFVDSTGRLVPDSSRVAESSGYPALDSAALGGARRLRFAPARKRGVPSATSFLQPIEFRHPAGADAVSAGEPDLTAPRAAAPEPTQLRPPTAAPPAPTVVRPARTDTARPRTDSVRARGDSGRARPDTLRPRRDTTATKPDSGASPH